LEDFTRQMKKRPAFLRESLAQFCSARWAVSPYPAHPALRSAESPPEVISAMGRLPSQGFRDAGWPSRRESEPSRATDERTTHARPLRTSRRPAQVSQPAWPFCARQGQPLSQEFARLVPALACVLQTNIRVDAKREPLLLAPEAVLKAPPLTTGSGNLEVHAPVRRTDDRAASRLRLRTPTSVSACLLTYSLGSTLRVASRKARSWAVSDGFRLMQRAPRRIDSALSPFRKGLQANHL
jgi:hypothetical protein